MLQKYIDELVHWRELSHLTKVWHSGSTKQSVEEAMSFNERLSLILVFPLEMANDLQQSVESQSLAEVMDHLVESHQLLKASLANSAAPLLTVSSIRDFDIRCFWSTI